MKTFVVLALSLTLAISIFAGTASAPFAAKTTVDNPVTEIFISAAIERTQVRVRYDPRYRRIGYPLGDVPKNTGVCTDLIIRAYRMIGIDLQALIHEDMAANFSAYPNRWGLSRPDTNIDHRRVPNIETFMQRAGAEIKARKDYQPGDLLTWRIGGNTPHIGIVTNRLSRDGQRWLIAHNIGFGPRVDDMLQSGNVEKHFRYLPEQSRLTSGTTQPGSSNHGKR